MKNFKLNTVFVHLQVY